MLAGFCLQLFCSADRDSFLHVHGTWACYELWCLQDHRQAGCLTQTSPCTSLSKPCPRYAAMLLMQHAS